MEKLKKYLEKISYDVLKQYAKENIKLPTITSLVTFITYYYSGIKKIFNLSFNNFIEQNALLVLLFIFLVTFLVSLIITYIKMNKKKRQKCNNDFFYLFNNPSNLPNYYSLLLKEWNKFIRENKFFEFKGDIFLKKWIESLINAKKIKRDPRPEFTKEELYYIYLTAQYVFPQKDLVQGSKKHFNGSENQIWKNLLFPKLKTENHIQDANRFISGVIHQHTKGLNLNYIDFGSGLLSSLLYLVSQKETISVNYLGIDISEKFCKMSNSLLIGKFTDESIMFEFEKEILNGDKLNIKENSENILNTDKFNPLFKHSHQISKLSPHNKYIIEENINDRNLQNRLIEIHKGNIDIITANYCLHHIPNPILLQNSILDRTCFKLWGTDVSKWNNLIKSTLTSFLFDKNQKNKFFNSLQSYSNKTINKEKMKELLDKYIENDRKEFFSVIDKLLKQNGIFFLSDPDGFSDWNAEQIYVHDWSHAIAHFSNLKNDIELIESLNNSMEFLTAYVQLRNDKKELVTIELNKDEIVNCTFYQKISEYKDKHLGYIIGFIKK